MGGNLYQCSTSFHIKTTTYNNTKRSYNLLDIVGESLRPLEMTGSQSDPGRDHGR